MATAVGAPTFRLRIGTCPRYPISARIRLPEPGRLGQCSDAPRLAGRSEAVTNERGGPLGVAMAAAAPRIAALRWLERRGSAGASCAGMVGRGRAAAAHGSFAGPGRARGNLHAHSNPDAR